MSHLAECVVDRVEEIVVDERESGRLLEEERKKYKLASIGVLDVPKADGLVRTTLEHLDRVHKQFTHVFFSDVERRLDETRLVEFKKSRPILTQQQQD